MRDRGPIPVVAVERLRRRTDFRAAARGVRASGHAFVVQMRRREDGERAGQDDPARIGFTVSKQVGNAVERNRVRRRLREVVRLAAADALHPGHDYVLIGRRSALALPFGEMKQELDAALNRIHEAGAKGTAKGTGKETGKGTGKGTGAQPQSPLHEAGSPRRRSPQPKSTPKNAP